MYYEADVTCRMIIRQSRIRRSYARIPMSIRIFFKENRMRLTRYVPLAFLAVTATAAVAGAQQVASTQGTAAVAHQGPRHHKKTETQADLQKEAKMTMADARALALRTVPNATIQTGEIEREGGKLIYSFDMKVAGKPGIDEVNIDAMTGKLVGNKHETPKDERVEAKADAKAAKH
jgi:uncharacterized membrane protein YkoI